MIGTWIVFAVSLVAWCWVIIKLVTWKEAHSFTESFGKDGLVSLALGFVLLVVWLILWAEWWQPLWFHMFYNILGFWIIAFAVVVLAIVVGGVLVFLDHEKIGIVAALVIFFIGGIAWIVIYGMFGGHWTKNYVYLQQTYYEIAELPDTTAVRFLPLEVAKEFGRSRIQEPRIQLADAQPIVVDNEVLWILARQPKGFFNQALRHADGFAIIDNQGKPEMIRQEMKFGEGMWGRDALSWQLRSRRYWSTVDEVYYLRTEGGEVLALAPYIDYSFHFPVMVPRWGGTFLVHSDGRIENLSPQEAMNHPDLEGIRVFPEAMARLRVEVFAYKNGIKNKAFSHRDQISIPDVSAVVGGNEMPFLLPTSQGKKWFVGAVPWGGEGIYRIFLVDARTGRVELFSLDQDTSLIGPSRARKFITTQAYPNFDWDQLIVLEPRPIIRGEEFYWMFTITSRAYTGVTDTVFVNASTSEAISFGSNKEAVLAFLRGEDSGRLIQIGGQPGVVAQPAVPLPQLPSIENPQDLDALIRQLKEIAEALEAIRDQQ